MTDLPIEIVVGAYIVREDRVLLVKHKTLDKWLSPGGHIEPAESTKGKVRIAEIPEEAVKREVGEELPDLDWRLVNYESLEPPLEGENAIPMSVNTHLIPGKDSHLHHCNFYLGLANSPYFRYNVKESKGARWFPYTELLFSMQDMPELTRRDSLKAIERWNRPF